MVLGSLAARQSESLSHLWIEGDTVDGLSQSSRERCRIDWIKRSRPQNWVYQQTSLARNDHLWNAADC